jgi:hypothetical protein
LANAIEKTTAWWLNRTTLSIQPILGKKTPRGIAGPFGKQDSVIRFHNEVDWKTGKLHRAITTQDLTQAHNLFPSEAEARAERDLILASIEVDAVLLFEERSEEKKEIPCPVTLSPVDMLPKPTTKLKQKIKIKRSKKSITGEAILLDKTNKSTSEISLPTSGELNLPKESEKTNGNS